MTLRLEDQDWNFKKSDTRYATHGIHTWLAAMIPALARRLIEITTPTKVLDPYCGGGAVCVEAILNGIPTAGVDANPLSAIITKTKTTLLFESDVNDTFKTIFNSVKKSKEQKLFFPDYKDYKIDYWFKSEHLKYIDNIARSVAKIEDKKIKTFFQCVFSATIRDVMLTYRNEIRLRRLEPHHLEKFDRNVLEIFQSRYLRSLKRVESLPKNAKAKVITGDVKNLPFQNDEFSTIICSPPYGDERNGVPYFQFVKNMMYWLGVPKKELEEYKTKVLGWYDRYTIKEKATPESKTLKRLLQDIASNPKSVNEAISFYHDYHLGLQEMARVTSDKIVIVIGNRILNKQIINNAAITTELFENIGLELLEHHKRDLPSKRIPRFGDVKNVEGGQIDKEDILIYSQK